MKIHILGFSLLTVILCHSIMAQDEPLTAEEQAELDALDKELASLGSSSILGLLDSLIQLEEELNRSKISFKAGYTNQSLKESRGVVTDQNGYYAGLSYYHKTGFFLDIINQWNSGFNPAYYLTTPSLGMLNTLGKHWSYLVSYEHYFFNKSLAEEDVYFPYSDAVNGSIYFISNYFETGADYSVIFGDEYLTHRVNLNLVGNFIIKKPWIFDLISIRPTVGFLFGNQIIQSYLVDRRFLDARLRYILVINNTAGLLNINFTTPVYLKIKDFTFSISYQYNLPQELPDEELGYDNSQVWGVHLNYIIGL